MSSARDAILGRLRHRRDGALTAPVSDFSVVQSKQWPAEEKVDLFQQTIESVHAEVRRVSQDNWLDKLKELVQAKGMKNMLAPQLAQVGVDVRAAWSADTLSAELPELLSYDRPIDGWKSELFSDVDGAVTDVRCAIAETGSLVLWPNNDQPRLMTLVPPIHFAILDADQIKNTFHEVIVSEDWVQEGLPTNALLISGPSKTADIEQTLAYGVHGPKELIVLIRQ